MENFSCYAYYDRIGSNVRRIRQEEGLTQEQLAEKADLSFTVIQKVEAGQSGSRIETLIRIAMVLNATLDILADMQEVDGKHRFRLEAVLMLFKDKSDDEIRFVVAMIDSMFKHKKQFLDR